MLNTLVHTLPNSTCTSQKYASPPALPQTPLLRHCGFCQPAAVVTEPLHLLMACGPFEEPLWCRICRGIKLGKADHVQAAAYSSAVCCGVFLYCVCGGRALFSSSYGWAEPAATCLQLPTALCAVCCFSVGAKGVVWP
jgi:hypothetical protein